MKEYNKPMVRVLDDTSEGIYAASGDVVVDNNDQEEKKKCRFGRSEASSGSDKCQACSYTGGLSSQAPSGIFVGEDDFNTCVDGMPIKKS